MLLHSSPQSVVVLVSEVFCLLVHRPLRFLERLFVFYWIEVNNVRRLLVEMKDEER